MYSPRAIVLVAAVAGGLAVALGAFAAHGLRDLLDARALEVFGTAVDYHFRHALALLATGVLAGRWRQPAAAAAALRLAAWLFTLGTTLFSGSLYLLALTGVGVLGAITPFGGLCLLGAWGALALAALRRPSATDGADVTRATK